MVIGLIRGSFGLSGKVRVESTSGEYDHFLDLTDVTLTKDDDAKIFTVESAEKGASGLLIKFKGIDSPEQGWVLSGWAIEVDRSRACPLKDGEYYVEDLKGCLLAYYAKTADKKTPEPLIAGTITGVLEGGAGDLLEVVLSESLNAGHIGADKQEGGKTVLVPFRKEFIGTVDIERRIVQLMHLWILE